MEDSSYLDHILKERACGVCGTDRRARRAPREDRCAVCAREAPPEDAVFAMARGAAKRVCSAECLEVSLQEGLAGRDMCPMCGSPWRDALFPARACGVCAASLPPEEGFAGLWRGGRLQTFCGPACLRAYLGRANPFCG